MLLLFEDILDLEHVEHGLADVGVGAPILMVTSATTSTQHTMMVRLLKLKTAILECFKIHESNSRKLSTREWRITNEVCSLLDVVAEVTIRIQGDADTHISQTMFNMLEIKEIFEEEEHNIRTLDQPYDGCDVLKEK